MNWSKTKNGLFLFFRENQLLIILLIIVGLYFFFYEPLYSLIYKKAISEFFNKIEASTFGDILFALIGISAIYYLVLSLRNRRPIFNDFIVPIAITALYLPHRMSIVDQHWHYLSLYN